MKILVVEDEKLLSDALCRLLQDAGYFTDAIYNGADALYYLEESDYGLIILDIMLPGMDGTSVLRQIRRQNSSIPVLMLTAKSAVSDKVSGLNAGADDYMTKPFHPDELLARVNALTRRMGAVVMDELVFHDLRLDLNTAALWCGSSQIQLTKREFDVARFLIKNSGMTTTKESLIVNVWGPQSDATENNVEAYISFLRKKLRYLKSNVTIRNIHKIGYRLEENNAQ